MTIAVDLGRKATKQTNNMDLDRTCICCGSKISLPSNFTKELQENDHEMVICLIRGLVKNN